ncbi:SEL1-like repeat protein [Candidatus Thioglobus sp.]|nr:SEL1-like repeat protein [Candidatus Thioglobus sp.]
MAEHRDIPAQYELGFMYFEGESVDKNLLKAKYYLKKAIKIHIIFTSNLASSNAFFRKLMYY